MKKSFGLSILIATTLLTLSGCGMVSKQMANPQKLQDKASVSIGVPADKITVSDISGDLDSVHFTAKVQGLNDRYYKCYYSSAIVVTSDTICNPIYSSVAAKLRAEKNGSDKANSTQCNALTKAAGQCK
ncbi:hypothetical protein [Celerinatantimonas sp. MCCC 1A17872]|uniref:hypothetical protein n=1 Tax=Celerinatantimonas sp. MCCC 1A17872 TaxID=3177514 RepID=UPI0038C6FB23